MPRLKQITIENFRSISDQIIIRFPQNQPTVLIGENNSGKSNIIRAIELMFGEFHPKYKKLDDFDHFDRDPNNQIIIKAEVSDFAGRLGRSFEFSCGGFIFRAKKGSENDFVAVQAEDRAENPYVSTALREELLCVVVNSEQNLNYQLSYSSKYTLLSRVTKAFHDKLTENEEKVNRLRGFFEEIKNTFLEVEEFNDFNINMSTLAESMLSNMTYALTFDFSAYDPSNYFKTMRVHPTENGETRAYEELGTGQQQILALSFAHAYAKSFLGQDLIFVIDEPEAHLHPLAQKWLAKQMFRMSEGGLQVILTTHSPHFIDLEYINGINLVRKSEGSTYVISNDARSLYDHCIATGSNTRKTQSETVVPFYSNQATAHILTGFFANKVILVEGLTEELSLPVYFSRLGFDPTEYGVEIIGVNGKGNLAKWWRLFTLYKIPTYICFDNDVSSKDDENGSRRKDALNAIGIPEDQLDRVLGIEDWNISNQFCVFGTDFETTMRASFEGYAEIEEEQKELLGSNSKHIIARETAKQIAIDVESIGQQRLLEVIERVKALEI